MAESALRSPILLPEIVEKILIEVLKLEDPDVDILRLENPFLTFFRCRGVNRLWRDCADNLIRNLGKSPEVQLSDKHKEYLFRDEYFAQFAAKLYKKDYWDDETALFKDRRLIPHYRDFLVRTLALRSNVTDSRTINLCPDFPDESKAEIAAISTEYAVLVRVSYGKITPQISIYDLNDTNDVPLQPRVFFRLREIHHPDIISDIDGKEHLLLNTFSGLVSIKLSEKKFTLFNVAPKVPRKLPLDAQILYRPADPLNYPNLICISDTAAEYFLVGYKDTQPTFVRTRWPSYEAVVGNNLRPKDRWRSDPKWIFCYGTFQIIINCLSRVTIKVLKKGRAGSGNTLGIQKSFNPLAFFNGGYITQARLESNVLFLGASTGLMHAYVLSKGGISEMDLAAPDFSYRHELGKPVKSISIARCNRDTGIVRILVCYPDRLHVITKSPSADFSQ